MAGVFDDRTFNLRIHTNTKRAVRLWLLRNQPPCSAMVLLISDSLERPLSTRESVRLRLHLFVCAWCAGYLKQLRFIRRILQLKASSSESVPTVASLSSVARERIVSTLNRKDQSI